VASLNNPYSLSALQQLHRIAVDFMHQFLVRLPVQTPSLHLHSLVEEAKGILGKMDQLAVNILGYILREKEGKKGV